MLFSFLPPSLQIVQVEMKSFKRVFNQAKVGWSLSKLLEKNAGPMKSHNDKKRSFVQPQMLVDAVAEEAHGQRQQAQNR